MKKQAGKQNPKHVWQGKVKKLAKSKHRVDMYIKDWARAKSKNTEQTVNF